MHKEMINGIKIHFYKSRDRMNPRENISKDKEK